MSKSKTSFDEIDKNSGEFKRTGSQYRNRIAKDSPFPPAAGRYVLYISLACPWASRCYALIQLKGLDEVIPVIVVEPTWGVLDKREADVHITDEERWNPPRGWIFAYDDEDPFPLSSRDIFNQCKTLRNLYEIDDPNYSGKYTVPVLWDTETKKIVNNESSEIFSMFNSEFDEFAKYPDVNLIPSELQSQITEWNEKIYDTINNGVYRCGFATKQQAYDKALIELFEMLEVVDQHLSKQRYLCGSVLTESDIRLFVTLIRFDIVYYTHFKTNVKRIEDFPNLSEYIRDIYQIPAVKSTVDFAQIKQHYFTSHQINPYSIVPGGPLINYDRPHLRAQLSSA